MLEKMLFGVMLAAPLGPVSVEMIKRGIIGGFWPAFNIRIGGVIGNSLCLILSYFFLSSIMEYKILFDLLSFCGSLFLIYMGLNTLTKVKNKIAIQASVTEHNTLESLTSGFILAIANPVAIIFWINIFAVSMAGKTELSMYDFIQNSSILLGVTIWGLFLSLILEGGKRIVDSLWLKIITALSGLLLIGFGGKYLIKTISLYY